MIETGLKVLQAKFSVNASDRALLSDLFFSVNYESLLTDFHKVQEIDFDDAYDACITITDKNCGYVDLDISVTDEYISLSGPILKATEKASDLRYTLFGNEGLFFRYVLMILEKKHAIYSMHACSLYDENDHHLYIVVGGAGSGKTCFLLAAIKRGMKLFSTEMTHVSVSAQATFHKGSLVDNIRISNLRHGYEFLLDKSRIELPNTKDEGTKKIAVDLSWAQTSEDILYGPKITIILPHIENECRNNTTVDMADERLVVKALFDNISEKIAQNVLLYDCLPVVGLDTPDLARNRLACVNKLTRHVGRSVRVLAGNNNCWDGIL
ncbi:MAG: hypothetical protein JW709_11410 [Sedimentisphaerales bacterium]|nr:hypothetical protein [Sedimentisphaerales bacterium]